MKKLHLIAKENRYDVLTLILRGNAEVLYHRYVHRMNAENRHPVHLTTTLDVKADFLKTAEFIRKEKVLGKTLTIEASDFSYQSDLEILEQIDDFLNKTI